MNRPVLKTLYWIAVGFVAGALAMVFLAQFERSRDDSAKAKIAVGR